MKFRSSLKTIANLIEPTWLELTVSLTIFLILVIVNQTSQYYAGSLTSLGSTSFKGTFLSAPTRWLGNVFATSNFSTIFDYLFWFFVGMVIYLIASRLVNNAEEFFDDINIRHYIWPKDSNKNRPAQEFIEKLAVRLISFIMFCYFVIRFLPILDHWWQINHVYTNLSVHTFEVYLLLFIYEALFVHGVVVTLRLLLLRRRLLAS